MIDYLLYTYGWGLQFLLNLVVGTVVLRRVSIDPEIPSPTLTCLAGWILGGMLFLHSLELFQSSTVLLVLFTAIVVALRKLLPLTFYAGSMISGGIVLWIALQPKFQAIGELSTRTGCSNNLHAIYRAIEKQTASSPVSAIHQTPQGGSSWRVALLPYLGRADLLAQYDVRQPWDAPENRPVLQQRVPEYVCPGARRYGPDRIVYSSYLLATPLTCKAQNTMRTAMTAELIGTSYLPLLVESHDSRIPWTEPRDLPESALPCAKRRLLRDLRSVNEMSSRHRGQVAHLLTADGRVWPLDLRRPSVLTENGLLDEEAFQR